MASAWRKRSRVWTAGLVVLLAGLQSSAFDPDSSGWGHLAITDSVLNEGYRLFGSGGGQGHDPFAVSLKADRSIVIGF